MEILPAIDLLDGKVVRLHQGDYAKVTVYADDAVAQAGAFARAGARRIHVVDLEGARRGEAVQAALVARIVRETGTGVQVGGGIRSLDQARAYRDAGADRIVVGTAAVRDPAFLEGVSALVPTVVAVDAREGWVSVQGWTETTGLRAEELALRARAAGAVAALYTDVARDGTGAGPNVDATAALARAVPGLEIIASGGVGTLAHLRALAATGVIGACVVGRALYDGSIRVEDALALASA